MRHDKVVIEFWSGNPKEDGELHGSVLERDGGAVMVLDIQDEDSWEPYLVVGNMTDGVYRGTNSRRGGTAKVDASWYDTGDRVFVGRWLEDGSDFLMRFELPT